MLYLRVLTAIILIPLVIWGILYSNTLSFAVVSAAIFLLAATEWLGMCSLKTLWLKISLLALFVLMLLGCYFWHSYIILVAGSLFWLLPLYWVSRYQGKAPQIFNHSLGKVTIGLVVLSMAWTALYVLKGLTNGPKWIILLLLLIWSTDTFAYFVGRFWGKDPLAKAVSPKKTWQGFWGGVIGALGVAVLLFVFLPMAPFNLFTWLGVSLITILLAVLGDLFESLVKRLSGVKDSGKILPGHGGVLDRIDSLLGALPFYTLSVVCLKGV